MLAMQGRYKRHVSAALAEIDAEIVTEKEAVKSRIAAENPNVSWCACGLNKERNKPRCRACKRTMRQAARLLTPPPSNYCACGNQAPRGGTKCGACVGPKYTARPLNKFEKATLLAW